MTLEQIRQMFHEGEEWNAVNNYNEKACGRRKLLEKHSTQFVWETQDTKRSWMQFPQASQVVEARDGFLVFRLFSPKQLVGSHITDRHRNATLTLERIQPAEVAA